jgi:hypothetical protein
MTGMPPAARGRFLKKLPPLCSGPPQKLLFNNKKFFGGARGARLAFFKKAPLVAEGKKLLTIQPHRTIINFKKSEAKKE